MTCNWGRIKHWGGGGSIVPKSVSFRNCRRNPRLQFKNILDSAIAASVPTLKLSNGIHASFPMAEHVRITIKMKHPSRKFLRLKEICLISAPCKQK